MGIENRDSERYEFNEIKLGKNRKYTTRSNQDELKRGYKIMSWN